MAKWLIKSEPDAYSIDDLRRDGHTLWEGVRNYQARNYLKAMQKGDQILFYHSSNEALGVVGLATVAGESVPDPSQFDGKGSHFDSKATRQQPRWFCPKIRFQKKFRTIIPLEELRKIKRLAKMQLLQRGSRLSVMPVTDAEFSIITSLGDPVATAGRRES